MAKGCVRIDKDDLDQYATAIMLCYLAEPGVIIALHASDQAESEEIERLRGDLATVKARHKDLMRAVVAGRLSGEFAAEAEPEMLNEIAKLEGQIKELSVPSELRGLAEPGADVAERWRSAPMRTRRATARALLTPERLGELRVLSSPRRGAIRVPADERVEFCHDQSAQRRVRFEQFRPWLGLAGLEARQHDTP